MLVVGAVFPIGAIALFTTIPLTFYPALVLSLR
jgi:hypothetical protein